MVFTKCCCCVDLRVGAIVIAILDIIAGLAGFGRGATWDNIIGCLALLAAGVCLLYGGIKYHQITTTVYLVFQMIGIVMYGIMVILMLVQGAASGNAQVLGVMVALFLVACLQIYFWLCVFSFLKGLKSGEIVSPV